MDLYQEISDLIGRGETAALCTITRSQGSTPRHVGSKMLVYADGNIRGSVGGGEMESRVIAEALQTLEDGSPRLLEYALTDPLRGDPGLCGGQLEVYVEPITPHPTILVVGAGHVGQAIVHLAKWLDFRVVVNDDRPEFCTPEAAPGADEYICSALSELTENMTITSQTYVVLTTRNIEIDTNGLPVLFDSPAAYLGVIGSARRWEKTRQALAAAGITPEVLEKVVSPMGLELNAETPEEIALSVMAEITMLRRGGDGKPMARS